MAPSRESADYERGNVAESLRGYIGPRICPIEMSRRFSTGGSLARVFAGPADESVRAVMTIDLAIPCLAWARADEPLKRSAVLRDKASIDI